MPFSSVSRNHKFILGLITLFSLILASGIVASQVKSPLSGINTLPAVTPTETPPLILTLEPTPGQSLPKLPLTATPRVMATRKDSSAGLPADSPSPSLEPLPFASGPLQIGTSSGNRPLEIFRFGNGVSQLLIVAGIHGGYEYNTIDLARQLIEHIRLHPEIIPDNKTLFILPVLNPDGEAIGYKPAGRSNGDGVDLNRNFPVNWQADWDRSGCWQSGPISAGAKPLSEPESRALSDFISSQNIDALLSYHSAGIGIYPGGHSYHPASNQLAEKLASVSTFPFPGLDTGCETTGMLVDYAADLDIAAVDLELATHWDTQFETNLAVLQAFLAWSYEEPKNRPSFPSK